MTNSLTIAGLSISETKGQPHTPAGTLAVNSNGIEGDRHQGPGLRQISMMHEAVVRAHFPEATNGHLAGLGQENILLAGDGLEALRLLDTLEMGDALLEVTQIGAKVNEGGAPLCSANNRCLLSDFGVFGRVVHGGAIDAGHAVRHQQRLLRAHVITVSDRASKGVYEDQSGPAVCALLEAWGEARHWGLWIESRIVPDEREAIASALEDARESQVDLVVTTGGTGVAPRDITPDVVADHADRLIPGIMEYIRVKYGAEMPMALTSRGVTAVMGNALVYTLPGSVKAVPEYLEEIFKTLEHMLLLLKGIEAHS